MRRNRNRKPHQRYNSYTRDNESKMSNMYRIKEKKLRQTVFEYVNRHVTKFTSPLFHLISIYLQFYDTIFYIQINSFFLI